MSGAAVRRSSAPGLRSPRHTLLSFPPRPGVAPASPAPHRWKPAPDQGQNRPFGRQVIRKLHEMLSLEPKTEHFVLSRGRRPAATPASRDPVSATAGAGPGRVPERSGRVSEPSSRVSERSSRVPRALGFRVRTLEPGVRTLRSGVRTLRLGVRTLGLGVPSVWVPCPDARGPGPSGCSPFRSSPADHLVLTSPSSVSPAPGRPAPRGEEACTRSGRGPPLCAPNDQKVAPNARFSASHRAFGARSG